MPAVVIVRNNAIGSAIAEALGHIAVEPLEHGKLVAVKPNDTWASGTTSPASPRPIRCAW